MPPELTPQQRSLIEEMNARPEMRGPAAARHAIGFAERQKRAADEAIGNIASELLGIRPEHNDTIYTQHPLMAGVLRKALGRAFEEGAASVARQMLDGIIKNGGLP